GRRRVGDRAARPVAIYAVPMRRAALLSLIVCLGACASADAGRPSGIDGKVVSGPTCPVERMPPDPGCTPRPLAATLRVHPAAERRLVIVVGAVVFVDTMFYAAIAPLLPGLAHSLHLSKLSAGVMTAAYPLGTLAGALPGGVLAVRVGPKRTVYAGLALLAGS